MNDMGVSENRLVPLNPLVLLIIIPMKNGCFIGNIPYFFRQTHIILFIDIIIIFIILLHIIKFILRQTVFFKLTLLLILSML